MAAAGNSIDVLRQQGELRLGERFSGSCNVYLAETEDKEVVGIAVWKPPMEVEDTTGTREGSGAGEAERKILQLLPSEVSTWWQEEFVPKHKELFESSFGEQEKSAWHLAMLCVHADYQGKGIARKLTTPAMQQATSQGRSMTLDTPSPDLVSMYERFGFQLRGQADFHVPPSMDFTVYAMLCPLKK